MKQFEKLFKDAKESIGTDNIEALAKAMFESGRVSVLEEVKALFHTVNESPGKRYIYEFYKYPGHETLSASMCRYRSSGVHIAEVVRKTDGEDGQYYLPVAWCEAKELMKLMGYNKTFEEKARKQAYFWYADNQNCASCQYFANECSGGFGLCQRRNLETRRDCWCANYKLQKED